MTARQFFKKPPTFSRLLPTFFSSLKINKMQKHTKKRRPSMKPRGEVNSPTVKFHNKYGKERERQVVRRRRNRAGGVVRLK